MTRKPYLMTVFHRHPLYTGGISDRLPPKDLGWPTLYTPVALVETHALEEAYNATQSIDRPWWQKRGRGVQKLGQARCRSTSVGDVIGYGRGFWTVADRGFVLVLRLQRGDVVDAYNITKDGLAVMGRGVVFSSTQSGVYVVGAGMSWGRMVRPHTNNLMLRFVQRCGLHQHKNLIGLTENLKGKA